MDLSQAITVAADVAPASILTVTVESHTTVTVGILQQGSDWGEVAINTFLSFLAIFAATGTVALLVTRYNKDFAVSERLNERRHKTADIFCANLEQYISDYFARDNDERGKSIAIKYNAYLLGFLEFVNSGDLSDKNRQEIEWEVFRLIKLDDREIPEEARIKILLSGVVRIRYLLTK